jgi:hypothetical protein
VHHHSKANVETVKAICAYVEQGVPVIDASALCGLPWSTVYGWRASHPQIDLLLSEAEAKATGKAVRRLMHEIDDPDGDWKAALEYLKRRRKDDWSDRQELHQQHDGQVEIVVRYEDEPQK